MKSSTFFLVTFGVATATLGFLSGRAQASDAFVWAPSDDAAVARGRETAERFKLLGLQELDVSLPDVFSPEGRKALRAGEEALRKAPGIKRVMGPSGVLDLRAGADGKAAVAKLLDDAPGDAQGQLVRERVLRRNDALGWFFGKDAKGHWTIARFLVEGEHGAVRKAGAAALQAAGLKVDGGKHHSLWPARDDEPYRSKRLAVVAIAALLGGLLGTRFGKPRALGVVLAAAGAGAAGLLVGAVDVAPVRAAGAQVIAAAVVGALVGAGVGLALSRVRAWRLSSAALAGIIGLGVVALVQAAALESRVAVRTDRWAGSPYLFVSVKGDMDEPIVLREVRRLTDWLRAQGGVEAAWSAADVFPAFSGVADEIQRIPDEARDVRRIWTQAAADSTLALALTPDHKETLVALRIRQEGGGAYAREILAKLDMYLKAEFRSSMLRMAVADMNLPGQTRTVAKGVLAGDTKERVIRICRRNGRPLTEDDELGIDRVAKQAAFVPTGEAKLKDELADEVKRFLGGPTAPPLPPAPKGKPRAAKPAKPVKGAGTSPEADKPVQIPGDVESLLGVIKEQPGDVKVDDVKAPLAIFYGDLAEDALRSAARELFDRLSDVRRRHAARINAKEMLFSADLPTTGPLADEVRGATLDAMAPTVGIPTPADSDGAILLDATTVGGAANDRALGEALDEGLRRGLAEAAAVLAVLLLLAGGPRALLLWPVGLAPLAVVVGAFGLRGRVVDFPETVALVAALAFGTALAVGLAARRPDDAGAAAP